MARPRERVRLVRSTDVTRLSFSLQLVILIVSAALSAGAAIWTTQRSSDRAIEKLSSDVRDILTRMDAAKQVDEQKARVSDERAAQLRESVQDIKRRQELQAYEIQALKETILKLPQPRGR